MLDHKTKRNIIIALIVAVLIIVAASIYVLWRKSNFASIDILVAPESAEIRIGDKQYQNGTNYIKPGKFKVEITKDGFEKYESEIDIVSGGKYNLSVALKETEFGSWYLDHPEDDMLQTTIGSQEADKAQEEFLATSEQIEKITPHYDESSKYIVFTERRDEKVIIKTFFNTCMDDNESMEYYKKDVAKWFSGQNIDYKKYKTVYYTLCDESEKPWD